MADMFDKWEQEFDYEGLQKDIDEAEKSSGSYKEVPHDTYEVSVERMELKESKKGDPMVSIWFKIVAGEYKGCRIFYNQVIANQYGIKNNNDVLRSMKLRTIENLEASGMKLFQNHRQYNNLLMDCAEEIDAEKITFELKYGEGKNGFHTYEITDVFEN